MKLNEMKLKSSLFKFISRIFGYFKAENIIHHTPTLLSWSYRNRSVPVIICILLM